MGEVSNIGSIDLQEDILLLETPSSRRGMQAIHLNKYSVMQSDGNS